MDELTISFLRKIYREFYFKHNQKIEFPTKMEEREFGYMLFGGGMVRHLSFKTSGELIAELVRQAPSSVYCSNALYFKPSSPMEEKDWKGAELIFDIDTDSIPTLCKTRHNRWYCQNCCSKGKLPKPIRCSNCSADNLREIHWVCEECFDLTKQHVYRLIDFLTKDFGISSSDIIVYFSGNQGYHIHVSNERFKQLDSQARLEITNYIRGTGLSINLKLLISNFSYYAWYMRINRSIASSHAKRDKLINEVIEKNAALIDQAVTTDVHRIFRMPGTLHGNSGMFKMKINSLENFNPEIDPIVLSDEDVRIKVEYSPQFFMKGNKFGPYTAEMVEMPTYAAVFLCAKDLARLV